MVSKFRMTKNRVYPRPHLQNVIWGHGLETGVVNQFTIFPIIMHDEGLGDPTAYEANPENAAFAVSEEPNCYPDSKIDSVFMQLEFNLTKAALETDKISALKICYMPIFMNFKDDYIAIDELSTLEIQDVLELQTESADRQGYPLFNGVDMPVPVVGSNLLAANVPGLTATQAIEGVAFSTGQYYKMLQYMTNAGKLRSVQGGLKWISLSKRFPTARIRIKQRKSTKAMNEFAMLAVLVGMPSVDDVHQFPTAGETTNVTHVKVRGVYTYNEWGEFFNMRKV